MMSPAKISYTVAEAASATGLSETTIRTLIRNGTLTAHYLKVRAEARTAKTPLILHDDLVACVTAAPTERVSA